MDVVEQIAKLLFLDLSKNLILVERHLIFNHNIPQNILNLRINSKWFVLIIIFAIAKSGEMEKITGEILKFQNFVQIF